MLSINATFAFSRSKVNAGRSMIFMARFSKGPIWFNVVFNQPFLHSFRMFLSINNNELIIFFNSETLFKIINSYYPLFLALSEMARIELTKTICL
jgi:hypothetical protein